MTDVRHAADNALRLLSELQLETGCYSSYGVQNPESAAQVVTALSALGIDPFSDARFIKGNNTLFDAIMAYQLDDGGFEHTLGGGYNQNATVQVFYSMVSAYRQENGLGSLYIFDTDMQKNAAQNSPSDQEEQNINETQTAAETRENAADMSDKSDKGDFNDGTFSYKIWIYAAATGCRRNCSVGTCAEKEYEQGKLHICNTDHGSRSYIRAFQQFSDRFRLLFIRERSRIHTICDVVDFLRIHCGTER